MRVMRRLRQLFRSRQIDRDLAQEIETHRALLREDLERRGLTPEVADAASRRALGNTTLAREDARSVWRWAAIERLWQDVGYGARMLRRNPSFTGVAVMTLALGLGATTAMFSVVNAVLLRPLPFHDPDRLVAISIADPSRDIREAGTSFPTVNDWRTQNQRFTDLAIWATAAARIQAGSEPERVATGFVSANLFTVLGVAPAIGRVFTAEEETARERVVVLSHALWQRRFGSDREVVGRMLEIDGESPEGAVEPIQRVRIIGVMPDGFFFPNRETQFWRPATLLGIDGKPKLYERQWTDRHTDRWRVIGRLRPGGTEANAEADLNLIGRRLAEVFPTPAGRAEFPGFAADVVFLRDQLTGKNIALGLWLLLGSVSLVLLIACANVASLLVARGTGRRRELAIRVALGAARGRIVRQLTVESLLLAALAGLLGLAAASSGIRLFASSTAGIVRLQDASIDTTVLAFTGLASLVAALIFGVAPAFGAARANHHDSLKESAISSSHSRRTRQVRGLLVVVECAMAVVLLAGAGLLVRSFVRLLSVDPGFDPRGVLLVRVDLPIPPAPGWREREWGAFRDIEDRIRAVPGVRHAGFIQNFRIASSPRTPVTFEVAAGEAEILNAEGDLDLTGVNVEDVTPGFFQAMAVPLRQGRFFTSAEQNQPVAIVNEEFVRRFMRGQNPIGRRFSPGAGGSKINWHTIVGIVGNMRRHGLEQPPVPEFFIPSTEPAMDLAVRVNGDPADVAAAVRQQIRAVLPGAIVIRMTTMDAFLAEWSADRRFQTLLLALFAVVALALAAVGIYGVVQFAAAQRMKELGIRVALGARGLDLVRLMMGQGLRLPLIGLAIGLLGAYLLVGVLRNLLFEVNSGDPITFAAVALLLGATAIPACYLPARRAARVDPIVVLRNE